MVRRCNVTWGTNLCHSHGRSVAILHSAPTQSAHELFDIGGDFLLHLALGIVTIPPSASGFPNFYPFEFEISMPPFKFKLKDAQSPIILPSLLNMLDHNFLISLPIACQRYLN